MSLAFQWWLYQMILAGMLEAHPHMGQAWYSCRCRC